MCKRRFHGWLVILMTLCKAMFLGRDLQSHFCTRPGGHEGLHYCEYDNIPQAPSWIEGYSLVKT